MNRILEELFDKNKVIKESMIRFPNLSSVEIMATAGFDMLTIDGEHYPFNNETIQNIVRIVHLHGKLCGLRVPFYHRNLISHYMDYGLDYILVPHVETADQAQGIIQSVKFSPKGKRGLCPITRDAMYGNIVSTEEYVLSRNSSTIVMIMVETKRGLENINEILEVEGIDVVCIGPSDVSESYGIPGQVNHPTIVTAISKAVSIIQSKNSIYNSMVNSGELAKISLKNGHRFFHIESDLQFMARGLKRVSNDFNASVKMDSSNKESFKVKLHDKIPALSLMMRFASPDWAELMCLFEPDALILDLEHFSFDIETIQQIVRVCDSYDVTVLVRPSKADFDYIPLFLDLGVAGVLYPDVRSAEEAINLINKVKFFPIGKRGYCPISRSNGYGSKYKTEEFPALSNKSTVIGVMIESLEGKEALDKILKLDEIDFISIGPADLSSSMGFNGTISHEVIKHVAEIEEKVLHAGKALECTVHNQKDIADYLNRGGTYFYYESDQQLLKSELNQLLGLIDEVVKQEFN